MNRPLLKAWTILRDKIVDHDLNISKEIQLELSKLKKNQWIQLNRISLVNLKMPTMKKNKIRKIIGIHIKHILLLTKMFINIKSMNQW